MNPGQDLNYQIDDHNYDGNHINGIIGTDKGIGVRQSFL